MRPLLRIPVVLLATLVAGAPLVPRGVRAEEPASDARSREQALRIELQETQILAAAHEECAKRLLRFAEELIADRRKHASSLDPRVEVLEHELRTRQARIAALEAAVAAERVRHAKLEADHEVAFANARRALRLQAVQLENAAALARTEHRLAQQEVERLHWAFSRQVPRDSVARVFASFPAAHWRSELASADARRARVAFAVLGVLPDPTPEGVEAILAAAQVDRALYDAALRPLVAIGTPAVQPLVTAACGEDPKRRLDRGWVMHVLGSMGPAAADAMPWLEELAAGDGREASQARLAIEQIRAR